MAQNKTYFLIGIGVVGIILASFLIDRGASRTAPASSQSQGNLSASQVSAPAAQPQASTQPNSTQPMQWQNPPAMTIDKNKTYIAALNTSDGVMKIELFAKEAPVTVNNYVFLARQGFYNGTIFHRIIKGFMIQGGDPQGTGMGGPGYKFQDEPVTRKYDRGIVAMANAGPNTNGSQFFIMHQNYNLPQNYSIFGRVIEGLDVLDKIANTPVAASPSGEPSQPTEKVTVNSVTIEEK